MKDQILFTILTKDAENIRVESCAESNNRTYYRNTSLHTEMGHPELLLLLSHTTAFMVI